MKKLLFILLAPAAALAVTYSDVTVNADGTLSKPTNFWTGNAAGICSGINATVAPAWSNITSKPTTLTGYGITDAQALDSDLTSISALTTTS